VYRNAQGVKIAKEQIKNAKDEFKKMQQAQLKKWSTGLVQKREKRLQKEAYQQAKTEKLTRYTLDKDEQEWLAAKERFNDPMAKLLKKKDHDKIKKIQIKLGKLCRFTAPPNRFGILAGYRWDGADRSNGYERRYLNNINEKKDRKQIA
jgi:pre-mRNA-splicing factor CWC26